MMSARRRGNAVAMRLHTTMGIACISLALAACTQGTTGAKMEGELVQRIRQAVRVDGDAWPATMVSGKAMRGGVEHTYSFAFLPDGRFVQSFQGPDSKTLGNDGKRLWQEDRAHDVQELEFASRDNLMAIGLLLSGNWLLGRAPVQLTSGNGVVHVLLRDSGNTVDVRVDSATGLPSGAAFQASDGTTLKFSDWRAAGDRMIPMHAEVTIDGDTEIFTADTASRIRPGDVRTEMPTANVTDFSIDPAKPASVESRFAGRRHIMVHALVNGQDVGWFILDSGAGAMVIDRALADSLGLERLSTGNAQGVGGTFESSARRVDRFDIGPMTIRNTRFGDYDFSSFNTGSGPRIAGTIGTPIFRRGVVAMNWNGPSVEIHERTSFRLQSGTWQRLRFSNDNPVVQAQTAGTPETWYRLDSGAAGFLTLHSPFVNQWKLLEGRETAAASSTGLGGTVTARNGTVDWFELGGHRTDNPAVTFSTATTGSFSDPYLAGNIGIEVLRPYTVVLDFAGGRVAFVEPTAR